MDIVGNEFLVDFGMAKATLDIQSENSLRFTITEKNGNEVNISETVEIEMTEIRPQLFIVTWQEKNGNTVMQVQDYEKGIVHSNWTLPNGEFIHQKGTLKAVGK